MVTGVTERHVNEGHIIVQYVDRGQQRRIEELQVRRPAPMQDV